MSNIKLKLQKQIETLPDELVSQIADFTLFIMARHQLKPEYIDWTDSEWQAVGLQSFFAEDDDVEYTLNDARELN